MAYEKFGQKIAELQLDWTLFKVEFIDRDGFNRFANEFYSNIYQYSEIWITGYFSETLRNDLEKIIRVDKRKIRLICPEFPLKSPRDKKNLEALKKLAKAGAEIKVNNRLHARFLVAHCPEAPQVMGLLIIGSFDFNTECIGRERYDAGIKTKNPDLVESARKLFEQIWKEPESLQLKEAFKL